MTIIAPMVDVAVTPHRARDMLVALADYHGLSVFAKEAALGDLVRQTEQYTIAAFYKHFTDCTRPSNAILLCIIEGLREGKPHQQERR